MKIILVAFFNVITNASAYAIMEDWDHFTFTQEWPQTACLLGELEQKECAIPPYISSFVIHGLWPSTRNTVGPQKCSNTPFDPMNIKNLTNELNDSWPNLFKTRDEYEFWRHEWVQHGTCAASLKATGTEYLYFRKTLDLMQKFNATKYLNAEKIYPSSKTSYSTADIAAKLSKRIGSDVDLQCYLDKNSRQSKSFLAEIRICMDKKFNVISCRNLVDSNLYFRTKKRPNTELCKGTLIIPEIKG